MSHTPPLTYTEWFRSTAIQNPSHPAVIDETCSVSFGELYSLASRVAFELRNRDLEIGSPVGLALTPSVAYLTVFLGVLFAGGVPAPLNTRLPTQDLSAYIERIGASCVVHDTAHEAVVEGIMTKSIAISGVANSDRLVNQLGSILGDELLDFAPHESSPAVIFPTGGTTGLPKGVFTDQRGLALWAWNVATTGRRHRQDVELYFSPFFHVTLVVGILAPLFVGSTIVIEQKFDPARAFSSMKSHGVTRLMGAPTMFKALMDSAEGNRPVLGQIRHITFGSAAASPEFIERLMEFFPNADLTTGLGATEFGSGVTKIDPEEIRVGSIHGVGRPVPGAQLRICDSDGRTVPTGKVGEIQVRSPWQTLGYWNQPEETASTYLPDGFIRLGDLGFLDENGRLTINGRLKEMIITGGENVFPVEVETAMLREDEVDEVVVFGVPDEHWGERIEAVVKLREGFDLDPTLFRDRLRKSVADYKIPKRIHVVDEIPLTPNNKPDRRNLSLKYT